MRKALILGAASVVAIAVAIAGLSRTGDDNVLPPTMQPDGEVVDKGILVQRRTIDYESIIKNAFAENASFLTLTWKRDVIRDQYLEQSINYTPFPASRARVRVKYHAEFPIGYDLRPGKFKVSGGANGLVITVGRPQLIARPSIKLQSYQILESGFLIDEKTALLRLQQRIQPEAEKRALRILKQPVVQIRSEAALTQLLQKILRATAEGEAPPPITFIYR